MSSKTTFEIQKTTADLERQKKIYNSVKLSLLPDKGAKLKDRINDLEDLLKNLSVSAADDVEEKPPVLEKTKININSECSNKLDTKTKSCSSTSAVNNISKQRSEIEIEKKSKSSNDLGNAALQVASKNKITDCTNQLDTKTKSYFSTTTKATDKTKQSFVKETETKSYAVGDTKLQVISLDSNSNDSGFNDGLEGHSKRDFNSTSNQNITIFKDKAAEEFISFKKLSEKADKNHPDPFKEVVQSPAFKSYRETKAIPKIKLTEAKPLFLEPNTKKGSKNVIVKHSHSLANEETVKQLHGALVFFPDDCVDEKPPKHLKVSLMAHQIKALSWLLWREAQIPSGGILADDMGLGKTLTMIALILKQREGQLASPTKKSDENATKGTLIVCIASIVRQWESEINKHCKAKAVNVLVYHGPNRVRSISHMKKFDVVVTTYQTLLAENKAGVESGLFELIWERIILDEAHTIKNHSSKTAEAVFSLKGLKRWCVTGTPIHNDFKDMYSLVKFLQFHPFDDYKKFKRLTDDKTDDYAERRNMLVKSILLRRTKTETDKSGKPLIDIVNKNLTITYIDLSPEERKVYEELFQKITDIIRRVVDNSSKKLKSTSSLLVLLLRVQQCCCHLSLLNQETEEITDNSMDEIAKGLTSLSLSNSSSDNNSSNSLLDMTFSEYESHTMYSKSVMSSKMAKLFEELDKIAKESNNRAKSVIVSQWVSMLQLVEYHLKKKKKMYHMIAGNTKSEERQTMSEDFNYNSDGCKIMLLSLKAGGVGLNLVGANHLFLLDLHWNPALEMQACDRIHRVGQKNDVFIHKFVCKNTIEEKILSLQNSKTNMALNALSGAGKIKKGLTLDDFKMLFNV